MDLPFVNFLFRFYSIFCKLKHGASKRPWDFRSTQVINSRREAPRASASASCISICGLTSKCESVISCGAASEHAGAIAGRESENDGGAQPEKAISDESGQAESKLGSRISKWNGGAAEVPRAAVGAHAEDSNEEGVLHRSESCYAIYAGCSAVYLEHVAAAIDGAERCDDIGVQEDRTSQSQVPGASCLVSWLNTRAQRPFWLHGATQRRLLDGDSCYEICSPAESCFNWFPIQSTCLQIILGSHQRHLQARNTRLLQRKWNQKSSYSTLSQNELRLHFLGSINISLAGQVRKEYTVFPRVLAYVLHRYAAAATLCGWEPIYPPKPSTKFLCLQKLQGFVD